MCWGKLIKIEKMLLNWYLVGVWNLLNSVRNDNLGYSLFYVRREDT